MQRNAFNTTISGSTASRLAQLRFAFIVTTMAFDQKHLDHAIGYLDASRAAQDGLRDAYASDTHAERDPARIASLHQAINYGLKAGEVSALIGVGEQLQALVAALTPAPDEARRLCDDSGLPSTTFPALVDSPMQSLSCTNGNHRQCPDPVWCDCTCHEIKEG